MCNLGFKVKPLKTKTLGVRSWKRTNQQKLPENALCSVLSEKCSFWETFILHNEDATTPNQAITATKHNII